MLFIVPEELSVKEENAEEPANTPESGAEEVKANVELDLDDAPFLNEPEPEKVPEEAPKEEPVAEEEVKLSFLKRLLQNKKLLIIAGGGLVAVIGIIVALMIFLGGDSSSEEAPKEEAPVEEVAEEKAPEEVPPPDPIIFTVEEGAEEPPTVLPYPFLVEWEPFLVPLYGSEGEVKLLSCTLALPIAEESLHAEIEAKRTVLRDAVFYYLSHHKNYLLNTEDAQMAFKSDIISVINERVSSAKLQEILVKDYLVQGP